MHEESLLAEIGHPVTCDAHHFLTLLRQDLPHWSSTRRWQARMYLRHLKARIEVTQNQLHQQEKNQ